MFFGTLFQNKSLNMIIVNLLGWLIISKNPSSKDVDWKYSKLFYKNGQRNSDHVKVLEKSEECISLISEAKKNYILEMTSKCEDSNTAPKTYWFILNCFLYNKKIPAIPPLLLDGNFISDFCEKANLLCYE